MNKHLRKIIRIKKSGIIIIASLLLIVVIGISAVRIFPGVGAQGAEILRGILGDQAVAMLENITFKIDDQVKSLEYRFGLAKSQTPWVVNQVPANTPLPAPQTKTKDIPIQVPRNAPLVSTAPRIQPIIPVARPWVPQNLPALGSLSGEGVWTPYLTGPSGRVVAYRTFLQPDPARPYAVVAIVAFNLQDSQLHFVLGTHEPYAKGVTQRGTGTIPAADLQSGNLLAAFNGGFKVEQGGFGAMADGIQAVPPRNGLATLAFYHNGQIQIGVWGQDINPSPDLVAYRQNGLMIVQMGQLTSQIDDPRYWGYTITRSTVTWRSAIGLDASRKILYYFAGPYLNINTLAAAIQDAGVQTAMELDINNYWVHFNSFTYQSGVLKPVPLMKAMTDGADRFLRPYDRDFFYLTAK